MDRFWTENNCDSLYMNQGINFLIQLLNTVKYPVQFLGTLRSADLRQTDIFSSISDPIFKYHNSFLPMWNLRWFLQVDYRYEYDYGYNKSLTLEGVGHKLLKALEDSLGNQYQ